MKNLELLYRSLHKPKPLWPESALYGGYTFIELSPGLWIPRTFEYLVAYGLNGTNRALAEQALAELKHVDKIHRPTMLQQSDYAKVCLILQNQTQICFEGYSFLFEQLISQFPNCTVYSDKAYASRQFIQTDLNNLCKYSSTLITFVSSTSFGLKSKMRNWGNVIPYDSTFFIDDLADTYALTGGCYGTES